VLRIIFKVYFLVKENAHAHTKRARTNIRNNRTPFVYWITAVSIFSFSQTNWFKIEEKNWKNNALQTISFIQMGCFL